MVPCGHAFSESAVKEVGGSEGVCLQVRHSFLAILSVSNRLLVTQCNVPYEPENAITINPVTAADVEKLQARIKALAERGLGHTLKKSSEGKSKKKRKEKPNEDGRSSKKDETSIKNAATASLTNKVMEDEKMRNKRRKMEMSNNLKSLFTAKDEKDILGKNDFMSRGYTIPEKR